MTDEYRINPVEELLVLDQGNLSGFFSAAPWRAATQDEIDEYLLDTAKNSKIEILKENRDAFLDAGFIYWGIISCPTWDDSTSYSKNDLVAASGVNYRSVADKNLNHEPASYPEWWFVFEPVFRIDFATLLNVDAKCRLNPSVPSAYKFFDKSDALGNRRQIDFGDAAGWSDFVESFLAEEDRVMRKYNDYRNKIADCSTVEELNAIVIDFNE